MPTNTMKYSTENIPEPVVITKNQKDSPTVTARALNLEDEVCILYGIDECY